MPPMGWSHGPRLAQLGDILARRSQQRAASSRQRRAAGRTSPTGRARWVVRQVGSRGPALVAVGANATQKSQRFRLLPGRRSTGSWLRLGARYRNLRRCWARETHGQRTSRPRFADPCSSGMGERRLSLVPFPATGPVPEVGGAGLSATDKVRPLSFGQSSSMTIVSSSRSRLKLAASTIL